MGHSLSVCGRCGSLNRFELNKAKSKEAVCGKCGQPLPMHGAVTSVGEADFWRILDKADKPVVVDFWASWCGPCRVYGPIFQEASLKTDRAIFLKLDTEANPNLSAQLGIRGIPATILFHNGQEIRRQAGVMPVESLLAFIG